MTPTLHTPPPLFARRGVVTLIVLWVLVIAITVIAIVQATSLGQATAGREALARTRALWAARAGVEAQIARLQEATQNPDIDNAFHVTEELADAAEGTLVDAAYAVGTTGRTGFLPGAVDAAAKINISLMSHDDLMTLPFMTEDVADSILDWVDADDDPMPLGAEIGYYQGQPYRYKPRNGRFRSLLEVELVAGVEPYFVRGEDWNLNGVLDPNENDGAESFPNDNADGILDAGWSQLVTTASVDGGLAASGAARLDLATAAENDLVTRLKVDNTQAKAMLDYVAATSSATIADFLRRRDLSQLAATTAVPGSRQPRINPLSDEQLAALTNECTIIRSSDAGTGPKPGKLNINTCDKRELEYLTAITPELADAIISDRDARRSGYTSFAQLSTVPGMSRRQLADLYEFLDVRSNVFVVTSRGRDALSGMEVEIVATLDRSTLPVVVSEVITR